MTTHKLLEDKASKFSNVVVRNLSSRGIHFVYLKIWIDLCNSLNNECGFLLWSPEWMMLFHSLQALLSALLMIFLLNLLSIILDSWRMEKWHYLKNTTLYCFFFFFLKDIDNCYNVMWWRTACRFTAIPVFKSSEIPDPGCSDLQAHCPSSWPLRTCLFLCFFFQ